jgi:hypothetical protein
MEGFFLSVNHPDRAARADDLAGGVADENSAWDGDKVAAGQGGDTATSKLKRTLSYNHTHVGLHSATDRFSLL